MAEAALNNASRPEVRRLASAMATAQESEIKAIGDMLAARGEPNPVEIDPGTAPPDDAGHHHGGT